MHGHAFANDGPEALEFDLHGIDARLERWKAIDAAAIGNARHRARNQHRARNRHRYTGHGAALGISHADQDRTRLHLGRDGERRNGQSEPGRKAILVLDSLPSPSRFRSCLTRLWMEQGYKHK